jgi:hypothetical protein
MEGTKLVTDTQAFERRGREAFCLARSLFARTSEPDRNEDLADSSNNSWIRISAT